MLKASVFIAGAVALAKGQEVEEGNFSLFQEGAQDLGSKEWTSRANQIFRACDQNKSGQITKSEFLNKACRGGTERDWVIA